MSFLAAHFLITALLRSHLPQTVLEDTRVMLKTRFLSWIRQVQKQCVDTDHMKWTLVSKIPTKETVGVWKPPRFSTRTLSSSHDVINSLGCDLKVVTGRFLVETRVIKQANGGWGLNSAEIEKTFSLTLKVEWTAHPSKEHYKQICYPFLFLLWTHKFVHFVLKMCSWWSCSG